MTVYSSVKPDILWVHKIESGKLIVRVRSNIKEIQVEDEDGTHTEYQYDETEIAHPLNPATMALDDIKALVVAKTAEINSAVGKEAVWVDISNQLKTLWGMA